MGAPQSDSGFFKGLFGVVSPKIEQHAKEEEALKANQAKLYTEAIQSGRLTPEQADYALKQLQKMYGHSKPIKEILGKVGGLLGRFSGKGQQAPSQGAQGSAAAQVMPPPQQAQASPTGEPSGGPAAQAQPTPSPALPPPSFSDVVGAGFPRKMSEEETMDLSHKQRMEEIDEQSKARGAKPIGSPQDIVGPDGKTHKYQQIIFPNGDYDKIDLGVSGAKPGSTSGVPRVIGKLAMSRAKDQATNNSQVYKEKDGEPLDPSKFPDDMMLVNVVHGTSDYWVPLSQNQTHFAVGNQVIAVPSLNQMDVGKGSEAQLGPQRVGTSSITEQFQFGTQRTTAVPTPGPTPRGATPPQPSPTAPPSGLPGAAPPSARPAGPASPAPSRALPGAGGGGRLGERVYAPGFENQQRRVGPIIQAATQLGGDPNNPASESLEILAPLADDQWSRQRMGKALRLTLDRMESVEKTTPGFWSMVEAQMGIPAIMADALAQMRSQVIGALTPPEREAYDKILAAYGTLVGMRTATGASASMAAVSTLERELPLPGLNSMSSKEVYTRLANLEQEASNYLDRQSDAAVSPKGDGAAVKKYYRDRGNYFRQKSKEAGKGGSKAAPAKGTVKNGYKFKGGDPAQESSWEPVNAGR